ncbi:hypothetical protein BH24ACI5_BH24ACI5_20080 [soil metagenome]
MTLLSGSRLGPYVIEAPLGAGGMSACGRAWGWGPARMKQR